MPYNNLLVIIRLILMPKLILDAKVLTWKRMEWSDQNNCDVNKLSRGQTGVLEWGKQRFAFTTIGVPFFLRFANNDLVNWWTKVVHCVMMLNLSTTTTKVDVEKCENVTSPICDHAPVVISNRSSSRTICLFILQCKGNLHCSLLISLLNYRYHR